MFSFLFGYSGRLSRLGYVAGALVFPVASALVQSLCTVLPLEHHVMASIATELLVDLAGTISGCALTVKRLHDINKPGTWLLSFGVLSPSQWLQLLAKPGDPAANDFGDPPPRMTGASQYQGMGPEPHPVSASADAPPTATASVVTAGTATETVRINRPGNLSARVNLAVPAGPAGFGRRTRAP